VKRKRLTTGKERHPPLRVTTYWYRLEQWPSSSTTQRCCVPPSLPQKFAEQIRKHVWLDVFSPFLLDRPMHSSHRPPYSLGSQQEACTVFRKHSHPVASHSVLVLMDKAFNFFSQSWTSFSCLRVADQKVPSAFPNSPTRTRRFFQMSSQLYWTPSQSKMLKLSLSFFPNKPNSESNFEIPSLYHF
jgi:hypothetical protein